MQVVSELMWKEISAELVTIDLEHLAWSQLDYNTETGGMQLMESQAHATELLINPIVHAAPFVVGSEDYGSQS